MKFVDSEFVISCDEHVTDLRYAFRDMFVTVISIATYLFDLVSYFTLLGSGSEWPKDQALLLTHSRHARNLFDPKIKRFFEIA